jgi:hypothetical protein
VKSVFTALLLLAGACAVQAAAQLSSAPREIASEYRVTQSGVTVGRVSESFVRRGDQYAITSVTRSEGPLKLVFDEQVTLESAGRVGRAGLEPLSFGQRRAGRPDRDLKATFDWDAHLMRATYRGERIEAALPDGTQDRLSLMYQFMNIGAESREQVQVPMSNGRKIELYTYRLVERVKLATPAGEFETLHYERVVKDAKEARAEVWLAREHHNFPVRVVFDDPRGLRLEQTLVQLKAK